MNINNKTEETKDSFSIVITRKIVNCAKLYAKRFIYNTLYIKFYVKIVHWIFDKNSKNKYRVT